MRKLKKGDKVVITCEDKRVNFNTKVAIVETSGKKWVTVKLEGDKTVFPYYFDVQNQYHESLFGGCKDGSYQIYRLYDNDTIENYENDMKMRVLKASVKDVIVNKLTYNLSQISYDDLVAISNNIDKLIENG